MSLLPLLMNLTLDVDPWERRRNRARWDSFGLGITPKDIPMSDLQSVRNNARQQESNNRGDVQQPPQVIGKDGFQVLMDVQQFRPNEISVKVIDNIVIVEGNHEERQDEHGSVTRQFRRKYQLPKYYDPKELVSTLSSDGILTIKVPLPQKSSSSERIIQIQQTGPAHLNVKDNPANKEADNRK